MDSLTWMEETIRQIHPPQDVFRRSCQARWDSLCKPIHGLGALEDMVSQIGAIQQTEQPDISRAVVVIMGADNGVVAEGVSQCGSEVTAQVLRNMAEGDSTVCQMARFRRTEVVAVDIGLNEPVNSPGVLNRAVRRGSGDIRTGPAMDRQEALQAIGEGIRIVHELKAQGCQILIPGEMGIGNTTTSAACVCAFFGKEPEKIAGPGAQGRGDPGRAARQPSGPGGRSRCSFEGRRTGHRRNDRAVSRKRRRRDSDGHRRTHRRTLCLHRRKAGWSGARVSDTGASGHGAGRPDPDGGTAAYPAPPPRDAPWRRQRSGAPAPASG